MSSMVPAGEIVLRIVTCNVAGMDGEVFRVPKTGATIGRDDNCTVCIKDKRISRNHAKVESVPGGFKVVDLGSANGVWVDEKQVSEVSLEPGARFRIGETLFELVGPPPAEPPEGPYDRTVAMKVPEIRKPTPSPPPRPAASPPSRPAPRAIEFIVRVAAVRGTATLPIGKEFPILGATTLGRSEDAGITLRDESASRLHAKLEATPDGKFKLSDNGSANGVWLDSRRIKEELIAPGQRFRIGDTFLEAHLPAPKKQEAGETRISDDLGELMAGMAAMRLETAGEGVVMSGSKPELLSDPGFAFYLVAGKVEIFTVTIKDGRPLGGRDHFLTLEPGEAFFGMDLGMVKDSGFLAMGKGGTQVRRIPIAQMRQIAADEHVGKKVAGLLDKWVSRMAARLTRDVPKLETEVRLENGKPATLEKGKRVKALDGVCWLEFEPGTVNFLSMNPLFPEQERVLFPLTPQLWLEAGGEVDKLELTGRECLSALDDDALWDGLHLFHQAVCEYEFVNKRLALVDEVQRLDIKAKQSEAAKGAAYDAIGAVLAGKNVEPDVGQSGSAEPVIAACRLVGQASGIRVKVPAEARTQRTFEDNLGAIASASRFRTRRVVLRGEWWKGDQGAVLAILEKGGVPVAILPKGPRAYQYVDPATGARQPMNADLAATLSPFAYTFYRGFPSGQIGAQDLLRFGARGLAPDFSAVVAMGVLTGVLGAATPFLTGQIIDQAIPQGEKSLLMQLGGGMLLTALASAAFKITQSIAVVRIESKMDYTLQAALWDRLLDLPSEFFRRFGAGDLAERAAGINAIRGILSRAGVGGILSAISSVAYVALMISYSFKLAAVAMGLTLLLVGFTTTGNYLQLKYQRQQTQVQGKLVGLVLQFITGVAKIRVCASENHAFRVWAQRFSEQKTLGFTIGNIQNTVGTFSSAFSVLSNLGIFGALWYFQSSAAPGEAMAFTTGTFIAFNGAFGSFTGAIQTLADSSLSLLRVVPVYERLKPILEAIPESDDSKAAPGRLRGEISISHLSFRYLEDGPWILKDVSFKIEPGEFVAFVGGSGCGKSTMMRLLLGFEKPSMGAIYYDGQDLSTLDVRAVRQQMGVVLQESRVLPTDIFRNIVGTTSHTMDEAWEAAEMAGLADDVRQMPMGMHTVVSEGGGTFSGGQRQRLLIARALVNKPKIIFFDEATSALDNKTQSVVSQSVDRMDATRISIAHRLSTVVNADKICYFEAGTIRESGSYDELMAKNGLFAELARRQVA
jgi:NHLM bacteriocin system ABC transporter ATP-binding protein